MTEKRDLLADLEICRSIKEHKYRVIVKNIGPPFRINEIPERYVEEAIQAWPETLNRAIVAEVEVEKLKSTVVILESLNKGLDIDCNELTTEVERLQEDNALLQIINSELVTIAKNYLNYIRSVPIAEGEGEVIKWVSEVLKRCRRDTDTGRS